MSTAALSRNPPRNAPARKAAAWLGTLISRIRLRMKIGKDRRRLQTVPGYLLADMGLERMEIRTSTGDHKVCIRPRR